MKETAVIIPVERIQKCILLIHNQKVILDSDLSTLYGVETKVLLQAVKRNIDRFPKDFMFQLTPNEFANLRSQIVTSSWGGRRYAPYAFTEQGIAMLSSVLRSKQAVRINIAIMRVFVKLREILTDNAALRRKVEQHDVLIKHIFKLLKPMGQEPKKLREPFGFHSKTAGQKKPSSRKSLK